MMKTLIFRMVLLQTRECGMAPPSQGPPPRMTGRAGGRGGCMGAGSIPGGSLTTPHSHCHQTWRIIIEQAI